MNNREKVREALKQQTRKNYEAARKNASASPDCSTAIVERGPWRAGSNSKDWFVESDDFTHDVRLVITGDFADDEQRWAYAQEIARRLNAAGR